MDLLSILPTDLVLIFRGDMSLARLNRLLKTYRLNYFIDRTEMQTNCPNAFKIFFLILTCVVLFHWNACAYFLISVSSGIESELIHLMLSQCNYVSYLAIKKKKMA